MMLYLRMIACWLEHTRLFIKVYNKKSKNVSLVHQRKKLKRKKRGKIDESAPSAKRGTLRCTPPIDRLCDCEIEWKLYRRAFSRFVLRSHKFAALLVHRLVATLARQWGLGSRTEEKKGTNESKKSLSSNSETEHRPRTKLDRLWRYLSGETPTRLQSPFLRLDVRLYVRNQQQICK
jgi:hypothetical protein